MNQGLEKALAAFDADHVGLSKGALSLVITLTRKAKSENFPLQPEKFKTRGGGQVAGVGGGAVSRILKEHGIDRVLSSEGGRTSRGSIEKMEGYLRLLNEHHLKGALDLDAVEAWWIQKILEFFDSKPFTFELDQARSLRSCVRELFAQAGQRQRETSGTMYVGALMQHLVGAKLDIISKANLSHHGFSVADAPSNRSSDFCLGDVAIHVTTAPTEGLMQKCQNNLSAGLRPLIVTTEDGIGGAKAFAKQAGLEDRVDVIEIEQFLATNIYEHSSFDPAARVATIKALIERYNVVVSETETDPSLRIAFES
jgi:hypothetical protein